jgi:hypothetical protein
MSALSDQILDISKVYLGPAAESFLSRQCKSHLKTDLSAVTREQIKDLSKWVEVGAGLIMDAAKAAVLARRIGDLG